MSLIDTIKPKIKDTPVKKDKEIVKLEKQLEKVDIEKEIKEEEKKEEEDKEEEKKIKFMNQNKSTFSVLYNNLKKYTLEKLPEQVKNLELSPQSQALVISLLLACANAVKIRGWRSIGPYIDYKVDKFLKQKRSGRPPNFPNLETTINKRMLLQNAGLLIFAYREEITEGLNLILDIEIDKTSIDKPILDNTPIAF